MVSTDRFDLRQWRADDAANLFAIYGDRETNRYVDDGSPLTLELCEKWINVTTENYRTRGYGMSAIIERESGEFVGCCGIIHARHRTEPEIKYAIRRDRWGKGIASEVVPAMLDYGFIQLGLIEIIATVNPQNLASIRVLEKAGMTFSELIEHDDGTRTTVYVVRQDLTSHD